MGFYWDVFCYDMISQNAKNGQRVYAMFSYELTPTVIVNECSDPNHIFFSIVARLHTVETIQHVAK